jgi:hypothetical protein
MLLTCSIIALILLLWFKTEVWLEYTRLLGLNFLSFFRDYDLKKQSDVTLTYQIYLRRYHDCFFVRLITCPICLTVWLSLLYVLGKAFIFFVLSSLLHVGLFTVILTAFGILLELPFLILLSLAIYGAIDRLLG